MPFHIEVATGRQHARSFNLTEEELRRTVLDPWLSGRAILLGDRKWTARRREAADPRRPGALQSRTSPSAKAGRTPSGRRPTSPRRCSAPPPSRQRAARGPATLVLHTDSPVQTLADIVSGHDTESVPVEEARERIDGRDPKVAAVILVVQRD